MTKKTNNKGFSLVELIIVIAIMAVLMVVLAPQLLRYVENSRLQRDNSAIAEIANAIEIACANEDVMAEIPAAGGTPASITINRDAQDNQEITLTVTGVTVAAPGGTSRLQTELQNTIGDPTTNPVVTSSRTYRDAANDLQFQIEATADGNVLVSVVNWADEVDAATQTHNF